MIILSLFQLNHPNGGYGFKIVAFVFLSDNELDFEYRGGITTGEYKSASLLMHDAQYTDEEYRSICSWLD